MKPEEKIKLSKNNKKLITMFLLGIFIGSLIGYVLTDCKLVKIDKGAEMFGWYDTPLNENCTKNTGEGYTCMHINPETVCGCVKK